MTLAARSAALVAVAALAGCVLAGCVVRAPQLERVLALTDRQEPVPIEAAAYAWQLSFNDARYTVYPVRLKTGGFAFGNRGGIRVWFDGRQVTGIEGMPGALGPVKITEYAGNVRWIERDGADLVILHCQPDERLGTGWRTRCTAPIGDARVPMDSEGIFDDAGDLRLIRVSFIPGASPLVLQRVSGP
jgi:hypothetical protein